MSSETNLVKSASGLKKHAAISSNQSEISIRQLRSKLSGRVITPEDDGYDEARIVFSGGIDRRPVAIVRVANAADVQTIVNLARQTGLELAVRSGGHSGAGHSVVDGGIVVDLRDMKALQIDAENHTAWAETGLTAGEFTAAAGKFGLATGFGDTGSVGIGGIALGGGVGFLSRKYGMTIDNLLAAEIVTADGKLLHIDNRSNPDLFWAIRGGGGNFGIVTRLQFRLHELKTIVGGSLILPVTPEIIESVIKESQSAPDDLSMILNIMPCPPMPFVPPEYHGKLILMAMMVFAGSAKNGERAIAPFRAIAHPIADMVKPMTYPEMFPPENGDYHPVAITHGMFLDKVDPGTAKTIVDFLNASDASVRAAQLRVLGGAIARVPAGDTAYAHRQSRIMASLATFIDKPEDRPVREAWIREFALALQQGDGGVYVNFLADEGEKRIHDAYPGQTWERLAAIKAHFDPTNLFHLNQNIPPAVDGNR